MSSPVRDIPTQHVDLCRNLREQLQRIAGTQQNDPEPNITANLTRLLNEMDRYIGWAENHKETIEVALPTKHTVTGNRHVA